MNLLELATYRVLIPDDTGGCGTETARDHQQGRRKMSDRSRVNIVIPCNIVKSCLISFDASIFKTCGLLLAIGFVLQLVLCGPQQSAV